MYGTGCVCFLEVTNWSWVNYSLRLERQSFCSRASHVSQKTGELLIRLTEGASYMVLLWLLFCCHGTVWDSFCLVRSIHWEMQDPEDAYKVQAHRKDLRGNMGIAEQRFVKKQRFFRCRLSLRHVRVQARELRRFHLLRRELHGTWELWHRTTLKNYTKSCKISLKTQKNNKLYIEQTSHRRLYKKKKLSYSPLYKLLTSYCSYLKEKSSEDHGTNAGRA